jgi:hypothetical protein
LSVRVVVFTVRSAVTVLVECVHCVLYWLNRASFVRSTVAERKRTVVCIFDSTSPRIQFVKYINVFMTSYSYRNNR